MCYAVLREQEEGFDPVCMDTSAKDIEVLQRLVKKAHDKTGSSLYIVEVGSWVGRTALAIEKAALGCAYDVDLKVFCVDTWEGSPTDQTGKIAQKYTKQGLFSGFCKNVGDRLFQTIIPCVGTSEFWASVWPFKVDMVFIDADHSHPHVSRDIEMWSKHVRKGGILCGHDYSPEFPGVVKAVNESGPYEHEGAIWWRKL